MRARTIAVLAAAAFGLASVQGCVVAQFLGGAAQNAEYQKKVQVLPEYTGLEGQEVAVLVNVNMTMMYEHPHLASQIALGVAYNVKQHVPSARVIAPDSTLAWQHRTPHWHLLSYSDMAKAIGATRVIMVDVYEYRLNPPGNRYEWDGVCAANVRVIESDEQRAAGELPAQEFEIIAKFPDQQGVPWESTNVSQISQGLMLKFIQQTAWLFYAHEEPKYPDKFNPSLDQ